MGNHEDNKESDDGVDDYDYEYDDPNDPYFRSYAPHRGERVMA